MHIPIKTYLESIPGFFGIRTEEEPDYHIVDRDNDGFEVRQYESTVQAKTVVQGDHDHAMNEGFRRLAGYIFGENSRREKFDMTTPVLEQSSETMSMTTPVLSNKTGGGWQMAFVLPSHVTQENAPVPQDDRIEIASVPPKTVATLRYSGNPTTEKREEKAKELLSLVEKHGYRVVSDVMFATYDQPFAIPFLKRNEVHVEVRH